MPTTPRPDPAVDPALLQPIDGVPDKMNRLLDMLAASRFGDIQPCTALLGTSTTQVARWRDKNPEFDRRIAQIQLELADAERANIKKRIRDLAMDGAKQTTEVYNGDDELTERRVMVKDDTTAALAYAAALMPTEFGKHAKPVDDSGPDSFTFQLGNKELEAGEVIAEEDGDA